MATQQPPAPAPAGSPPGRTRSFILWAFFISILIHFVALPFLQLHASNNEKDKVEKVSMSHKVKVVVPTPPPPTPTPPPPTPPPLKTPPPVKQTNPPPQPKLKLNVPKSTSNKGPATENRYNVTKGSEDAVPNGTEASGKPTVVSNVPAATPAPTPVPTATPTPKPECANPNADAQIKGTAVEPEYPEIAKDQGAVGTTQVKVTLDASGAVESASVYKSAGNPALDNAAIAAAKATAYIPETVNCVKTAGSYIFRADFTGQ